MDRCNSFRMSQDAGRIPICILSVQKGSDKVAVWAVVWRR